MGSFEKVCDDCPLRCVVNLDYAAEEHSMGSDGVKVVLDDGSNARTVTIAAGEVNSSSQSNAAWHATDERIANCEGPDVGLLRQKCGARLASAWRWARLHGEELSLDSVEKIQGAIVKATAGDALRSTLTESTWILGSAEDYVEPSFNSPYWRQGYFRLTRKLKGPGVTLRRGFVFGLDSSLTTIKVDDERLPIFAITGFNGPSYHFTHERVDGDEDNARIAFEGITQLLASTPEDNKKSNELAEKIWEEARQHQRALREAIDSGEFARALGEASDRIKGEVVDEK